MYLCPWAMVKGNMRSNHGKGRHRPDFLDWRLPIRHLCTYIGVVNSEADIEPSLGPGTHLVSHIAFLYLGMLISQGIMPIFTKRMYDHIHIQKCPRML